MSATSYPSNKGLFGLSRGIRIRRGMAWGLLILAALIAFEVFNYSTTEYALSDVLGQLRFGGINWATILAIAFCGIDFAGIARLFTPEKGRDEPAEVWYLFGAWLLAAGVNAMLTWWGVSLAIINHNSLGGGIVVSDSTMTKVVPVFVAIMVWLIRVLIIGTFSVAGERLFSQDDQPRAYAKTPTAAHSVARSRPGVPGASTATPFRAAPRIVKPMAGYRQDPNYHSVSKSARPVREAEYIDTPYNA